MRIDISYQLPVASDPVCLEDVIEHQAEFSEVLGLLETNPNVTVTVIVDEQPSELDAEEESQFFNVAETLRENGQDVDYHIAGGSETLDTSGLVCQFLAERPNNDREIEARLNQACRWAGILGSKIVQKRISARLANLLQEFHVPIPEKEILNQIRGHIPDPFLPRILAKSFLRKHANALRRNGGYEDVQQFSVLPYGKGWLIYRDGWWRELSHLDMEAETIQHYQQRCDELGIPGKPTVTNLIGNMMTELRGMTYVAPVVHLPVYICRQEEDGKVTECFEHRNWLATRNCILDLDILCGNSSTAYDEAIQAASRPLSSRWVSTARIPYSIDTETSCQRWLQYLNDVFPGEYADQIDTLQEYFGYCLIPSNRFKRFMVLTGDSDSGKSVTASILLKMLGDENVSSVTMETFGDRFALVPMIGKLANIQEEMERYEKVRTGKLKLLVNGSPGPPVDRKNDSIVTLEPVPKLLFICNNLPHVEDSSKGTWNRLLLIHYPRTFTEDEQNKGLVNEIVREELPGILNWAIQGLMRLVRNGRFSESANSRQAKDEYRTKCNQTRQFVEDELELGESKAIYSTDAFTLYKKWADESGIKNRLTKSRFIEEMNRIEGVTYDKIRGGKRCFQGVGVALTHPQFCRVTPDFAKPDHAAIARMNAEQSANSEETGPKTVPCVAEKLGQQNGYASVASQN